MMWGGTEDYDGVGVPTRTLTARRKNVLGKKEKG